jgi:hypothetical protein
MLQLDVACLFQMKNGPQKAYSLIRFFGSRTRKKILEKCQNVRNGLKLFYQILESYYLLIGCFASI